MNALLRHAGLVITDLALVLLGNPLSARTSAPELVPTGRSAIGHRMPLGATVDLLRGVSGFDGHGTASRRRREPLSLAAVVVLLANAWPVLDPGLSPPAQRLAEAATTLGWSLFATDHMVRLPLAKQRSRFVRRHSPDLLVIALPFLL